MKWMRNLLVGLLLAGSAGSAMAQAPAPILNDSEQPGSVIVFPKFVTGQVTVNGVVTPRSSFEISVVCPPGRNCPEFTDTVKIKALWVCPGSQAPAQKRICRVQNFELFTTVKGTLWFNPENLTSHMSPGGTGGPAGGVTQVPFVPAPPCQRGYLIAWVINNLDQPISFNGLIGNSIIRNGPDDANSFNAVPVQAVKPPGTILTTNPNDNLRFDGVDMYAQLTSRVYGTVRYERQGTGEVRTTLTLLTLDVKGNRTNLVTFVPFNFYNENERVISSFTEFICWQERRLTQIDGNLRGGPAPAGFGGLGALKGLVEVPEPGATQQNTELPFDTFPATLLGVIETWEFTNNPGRLTPPDRSYSYSMFHDEIGVSTRFCPIVGGPCPTP